MDENFEKLLKENAKKVDEEIKKILPKEFSNEWFNITFSKTEYQYDSLSCTYALTKPVLELLERGGKRWRPLLMLLCYNLIKKNSKNDLIVEKFLPLVEIIHNGTLMTDDVEDDSNFRRGGLCINKLFGVDIAINAGNFLYYLPYTIIKDSNLEPKTKLKIHELISEEMLKLHFGQGMDIYWHKNKVIPNEKQYFQMCAFKTGTLSRISAKLGVILGGGTKEQEKILGKFAETIGIAFQIKDDILNLINDNWGKDFGDDISEGKKSLVILKTLEKLNENDKKRLLEILHLKTKDHNLIKEAIEIIKSNTAIEDSKEIANQMVLNAWNEINSTFQDSKTKNQLKQLAYYFLEREI